MNKQINKRRNELLDGSAYSLLPAQKQRWLFGGHQAIWDYRFMQAVVLRLLGPCIHCGTYCSVENYIGQGHPSWNFTGIWMYCIIGNGVTMATVAAGSKAMLNATISVFALWLSKQIRICGHLGTWPCTISGKGWGFLNMRLWHLGSWRQVGHVW